MYMCNSVVCGNKFLLHLEHADGKEGKVLGKFSIIGILCSRGEGKQGSFGVGKGDLLMLLLNVGISTQHSASPSRGVQILSRRGAGGGRK